MTHKPVIKCEHADTRRIHIHVKLNSPAQTKQTLNLFFNALSD